LSPLLCSDLSLRVSRADDRQVSGSQILFSEPSALTPDQSIG
jgi:hypothetical protein